MTFRFSKLAKLAVPMVALAMLTGIHATRAEDAAAPAPAGKATITVKVVKEDSTPVANATVSLLPAAKGAAKGTAIATGTTDKDGKAILMNIADGSYSVSAKSKVDGKGKDKVTIESGKDATVTVTLTAKAAKKPAAPATPATPAPTAAN